MVLHRLTCRVVLIVKLLLDRLLVRGRLWHLRLLRSRPSHGCLLGILLRIGVLLLLLLRVLWLLLMLLGSMLRVGLGTCLILMLHVLLGLKLLGLERLRLELLGLELLLRGGVMSLQLLVWSRLRKVLWRLVPRFLPLQSLLLLLWLRLTNLL